MTQDAHFDARVRPQRSGEPRHEVLVTFALHGVGVKTGANDIMAIIVHTKDEISAVSRRNTSSIRQSRDVFADFFRAAAALLEIEPL
jgi:hypothetical protein